MTHLKSHAIYIALRERILSNDIGPGTRLVMRDVANQYEASDIPVREALRMLERDGLVETAPYRGARVTTLTAKEVEETYFIRSHLESIATGLAAERITGAELAQLDLVAEVEVDGQRAYVLAALRDVDAVVTFSEDTPLALIRRLRPDVLVKGGDYEPATVVGRDEVESWGGRVVIVPLRPGQSTTAIIDKLRAQG